ncbi:MAG: class I SAM-dependent methyltransferase [Candidatus Aenigmarchaeota archaeon]|nr:class I SAM-dependent methyltransferase [Candidatus Aenigmarchaeota archaeon]
MTNKNRETHAEQEGLLEEYFENVPCPVCGQNQYKRIFNVDYHIPAEDLTEFEWHTFMVKCKICSHTFVQPQFRRTILERHYALRSSDYYEKIGDTESKLYSKRNLKIIKDIECFVQGGRLLEIGCGTGNFIRHLSSKWQIYGVEPSKWAVGQLQKRGVRGTFVNDVFSGGIYPKGFFDVVVLIDVMEHIQRPTEFISSVELCMRPMGILVILTGNCRSLAARMLRSRWGYLRSAEHCSIFNKGSLTYLLERSGFSIIRSRIINHNNNKITLNHQFGNFKLIAKRVTGRYLTKRKNKFFLAGLLDHFITYAAKGELKQ